MKEEDIIWIENNGCKYYKKEFLGKGGFSKVYSFINIGVCNKGGLHDLSKSKEVACKIIKKMEKQKFVIEIGIHKNLHHENVLKLFDSFDDINYIYIILELCTQSLHTIILNNQEFDIIDYFKQIIEGLNYLHNLKPYPLIHGDLKIDNILVLNSTIKISDFGLSFYNIDNKYKITSGTVNYMAPEIFISKSVLSSDIEKIDIWACGIILFYMLYKYNPFPGTTHKEIIKNVINSKIIFPFNNNNFFIISIIKLLLQYYPEHRPSTTQILAILKSEP